MGVPAIVFRAARPEDHGPVEALLRRSGLPVDGLQEHFSRARVAARAGELVACVALEVYGDTALLRSLAVAEGYRGLRLGERLVRDALQHARRLGAADVYLLTETAVGFFPRFGFSQKGRSAAPAGLSASAEFRSACPASAVLMHARVPPE